LLLALFSTQVKVTSCWRTQISPTNGGDAFGRVLLRRNDMFLDEGLATYSAALYVQDVAGDISV
jgi:hypothetical protein